MLLAHHHTTANRLYQQQQSFAFPCIALALALLFARLGKCLASFFLPQHLRRPNPAASTISFAYTLPKQMALSLSVAVLCCSHPHTNQLHRPSISSIHHPIFHYVALPLLLSCVGLVGPPKPMDPADRFTIFPKFLQQLIHSSAYFQMVRIMNFVHGFGWRIILTVFQNLFIYLFCFLYPRKWETF